MTHRHSIVCHLKMFPVMLLLLFSKMAIGAPLLLSDTELDSVAAGYVNLYGNASAEAFGEIAIADIYVDAAQTIIHSDDGQTYTISTITANAAAIGERVKTAVSAGFDTDEKIVSLDIEHTSATGVTHVLPSALVAGQFMAPVHNKKTSDKPEKRSHHPQKRHKKRSNRKKTAHRHHKNKSRKRHSNNKQANKHRKRQKHKNRGEKRRPMVFENKSVTLTLVTVQPMK